MLAFAIAAFAIGSAMAATGSSSASTASPSATYVPITWNLDGADSMLQYGVCDDEETGATDPFSMSFTFVGTDVKFIGTADPSTSFSLTIDGKTKTVNASTTANTTLAEAQVAMGQHTVTLELTEGEATIDHVQFLTQMHTQASAFDKSVVATKKFVQNDTSLYQYKGNWTADKTGYLTGAPGSSVLATVPANSSYLVITGGSTQASTFELFLNPPTPFGVSNVTLDTQASQATGILFMTVLDPTVKYNLAFAVDAGANPISLDSTTFYSSIKAPASAADAAAPTNTAEAANSGAQSKSRAGAIAGGVIGGLVAVTLLIFVTTFLYRRFVNSGRTNRRALWSSKYVDEKPAMNITHPHPYAFTFPGVNSGTFNGNSDGNRGTRYTDNDFKTEYPQPLVDGDATRAAMGSTNVVNSHSISDAGRTHGQW
jgi:hypothetical protein